MSGLPIRRHAAGSARHRLRLGLVRRKGPAGDRHRPLHRTRSEDDLPGPQPRGDAVAHDAERAGPDLEHGGERAIVDATRPEGLDQRQAGRVIRAQDREIARPVALNALDIAVDLPAGRRLWVQHHRLQAQAGRLHRRRHAAGPGADDGEIDDPAHLAATGLPRIRRRRMPSRTGTRQP